MNEEKVIGALEECYSRWMLKQKILWKILYTQTIL